LPIITKKPKKMKSKTLLNALVFFLSVNLCSAQFIVKDETFAPGGVSNSGKVVGYQMQTGPYTLWLPDSGNVIINIGGIAPGSGVAGQSRFSTDGNFISGTSMGALGPEMSKYNRSTPPQ
jgi:hypothetical protein